MNIRLGIVFCYVALSTVMAGCTTAPSKAYRNYRTSIIRFLGNDERTIQIQNSTAPTLTVPLKAGIAFAPSMDYGEGFPEKERMSLMQKIAEQFKTYEFVESIELIPSLYL